MKKVLLTGSTGFIGRNIKESFLSEEYELFTPKRRELDLRDFDSVREYFKNKEFDAVLHCACKPGHRNAKDKSALFETNYKMFKNLVHFKNSYDKFINFGSGAIYDTSRNITNAKEEQIFEREGKDEHGKCKFYVKKEIDKLNNFIDLNIFGIFGKYEDYSIRFISNAICKTIFELPPTLRQNRRFSYLYIDDLMPILKFFIENTTRHNSYNIVPDEKTNLLTLAETVIEISGKTLGVKIEKEGWGLDYTGDNTRLKNEFQSVRFTKLYNAAVWLYDWYEKNKRLIDKSSLLFDK